MASKPILWEFTPKDLVMALGFVVTVVSHYYSTVSAFETHKIEEDAKIEVINYRLGALERGSNKVAYSEPNQAILPQSTRFKRNALIFNTSN